MAEPAPTRRCACIDVGSNTVRLLVAGAPAGAGGPRALAAHRAFTRLGAGRDGDGCLGDARVVATIDAVAAQVTLARAHGVEAIAVVATAAVRGAPNAPTLIAGVRARCDLAVRILDARTEAALTFAGATVGDGGAQRVAVVDVGGGSTEIAVGRPRGTPDWSGSIALGSGGLAEACPAGDPPDAAALAALRRHAREAVAALSPPRPARALAVGGSAMSCAQVLGGGLLDAAGLARALDALRAQPAAAIAARHGLHPGRARLLPAGLVLLEAAAQRLGCGLALAPGGLREGVILAMLEGAWPSRATSPD